jgi:hypothetical protein
MVPPSLKSSLGGSRTVADVEIYEALDPRSDEPPRELIALAARPDTLDGLRICVVQTMPPGSGLEPIIDGFLRLISHRYPTATATHYMRTNFMMTDISEIDYVAANFDAAVLVGGPAATMVHLAVVFASELERRGVPAPLIHFETLTPTAHHSITTVGAPVRAWPIGNPPRTDAATDAAINAVIADLTTPTSPDEMLTGLRVPTPRPRVAIRGRLADVLDHFHAEGWTDGLPIVPPTEANIAAMLRGTSHAPDDVVTESFRPEGRRVTVEMVAINAVMAGAKPSYLPVILASASVFGDLQFESMTRSVNSFAFAQLVNGPIATEIGMTGGLGALGPGNQANATIGRVLNLLFRTVGGARSGVNTTPTQGSAVAYALAFAENEAATPWDPFHVSLGYGAEESTVSILLGGWAHNGNFYYGTLEDVVTTLNSFEMPQTGAFVFMSEKRAHLMAEAGETKASIEGYLYDHATMCLKDFRASGFYPMCRSQIEGKGPTTAKVWPTDYLTRPDDDIVPAYPPDSIKVVVVGSDVSSTMQAWKLQLHRTVSVDAWR